MNTEERRAIFAIPIVLLIAVGLALAGGYRGQEVGGVSIYMICVGIAFLVQWIVFIPSYLAKTEKYFDLTGGITYISVTLFAVVVSSEIDTRAAIVALLVSIWALRLGLFLFNRIRNAGEDRRFREIKTSFLRFLMTWTLQGLWVSFSLAAALVVITSELRVTFGLLGFLGLSIWIFGFSIEVIADMQKSKFKADPDNEDKFIRSGLWAWSRHPNYFGEIVLWTGIAVISLPVLRGWQWIALISPVFVTLLLTKISGVPMLEKRADEKWGGQDEYEEYKKNTPVLILRPPIKQG